jgi:multidrug efflux pump subunit AcrB
MSAVCAAAANHVAAAPAFVKKQFFLISDCPEVLIEVQMPYGTSIAQTSAATAKVEDWLSRQEEARIVTAYVGQGAPRFYFSMEPELPDSAFAKIVVRTDNQDEREALKHRLRRAIADGLAPEARVRVTQLVFGPYSPFPVASGSLALGPSSCARSRLTCSRSWMPAR